MTVCGHINTLLEQLRALNTSASDDGNMEEDNKEESGAAGANVAKGLLPDR